MRNQHDKIKELKLRAMPLNLSGSYVDADGNLRSLDLKIITSDSDRTVKGYLTVWGVRDTFGTAFIKGAFKKSIQERGPDSDSKQKIAILWQHEVDNPIGRFTVLKEDPYGLYFEAEMDDVEIGERALRQIRSGTLNQFSFGFEYLWDKMEYDENSDTILVFEAVLYEGSVVTFGSNAETYAIRSIEQFEKEKESLDFETSELIKSLPRSNQLEIRQLISKHISLSSIKPQEVRQQALEKAKPILSYELLGKLIDKQNI